LFKCGFVELDNIECEITRRVWDNIEYEEWGISG
jgi:hypothetical protein